MELMQLEITLTSLIALLALGASVYGIYLSRRRGNDGDLKELTSTLTSISTRLVTLEENSPQIKTLGSTLATITTKIETIEGAVLSKPSLTEQVAVHGQKIADHERRISKLEGSK